MLAILTHIFALSYVFKYFHIFSFFYTNKCLIIFILKEKQLNVTIFTTCLFLNARIQSAMRTRKRVHYTNLQNLIMRSLSSTTHEHDRESGDDIAPDIRSPSPADTQAMLSPTPKQPGVTAQNTFGQPLTRKALRTNSGECNDNATCIVGSPSNAINNSALSTSLLPSPPPPPGSGIPKKKSSINCECNKSKPPPPFSWKICLSEWLLFLVMLAVFGILFRNNNGTHEQCISTNEHSCTDGNTHIPPSYNMEIAFFKHEQDVSSLEVYYGCLSMWIFMFVASFLLFLAFEKYNNKNNTSLLRVVDFFHCAVILECVVRTTLMAIVLCQITVFVIKVFVGRPRPWYWSDTNDPEARLSFVSGHSSAVFCSHMILCCHIIHAMTHTHTKQHTHSRGGRPPQCCRCRCGGRSAAAHNIHILFGGPLWQRIRAHSNFKIVFVVVYCLMWPLYVMCTRVIDYWHHYSDVIGGAMIGIMFAVISFAIQWKEIHGRHFCCSSVLTTEAKKDRTTTIQSDRNYYAIIEEKQHSRM